MSVDFAFRLIGMMVFALLGARGGQDTAAALGLSPVATSIIFALLGLLFGLIMTPWITIRPMRLLKNIISKTPMDVLFTGFAGLLIGLLLGLLAAYPLALIWPLLGSTLTPLIALAAAYSGMTLFASRSREVWAFINDGLGIGHRLSSNGAGSPLTFLLDTSVLIDGRIVDIARTGFLPGTLVAPQFVISELHRVASSPNEERHRRGEYGLKKLDELQHETSVSFKISEDDIENVTEVDDKLVALAERLDAPIVTLDFPLNQIAQAHGVTVLNINLLANAVRSAYIPGETFDLRILQEGTGPNQGVGYLENGTMVIVENGNHHIGETIAVRAVRLITKPTGHIIFAMPVDN